MLTPRRVRLREADPLSAVFHARGTVPRVSQCHALARSGIPPLEPLFNGSLCDDAGALDQFLQNAASMMEGGKAADRRKDAAARRNDAAAVETVPPLAVPRCVARERCQEQSMWQC